MIDIIKQILALPIGEELLFLLIMFGSFTLSDMLVDIIRFRWRKQAQYDCDKCSVWDCPVHICRKKKEKIEKH